MTRPRAALALAGTLLALAGCARPRARVEVDLARFSAEVDRRAEKAVNRPEVNAALDRLVGALAADPAVTGAAEPLVAALAADPGLSASFTAIVDLISEDAGLQELIVRLMRERPGLGPDQIGALLEKRIGAAVDGQPFDQALDRAIEKLFADPRVAGAVGRVAEAVARSDSLARALRDVVDVRALEGRLGERLRTLNGGSWPGRGRATDLLLERMFTVERLARFYERLFSMPLLRKELTAAAARLLASEPFGRIATRRLGPVVADPELRRRVAKVSRLLLEDQPSSADLAAAVSAILSLPVVAEQSAGFVDDLAREPALADLGRGLLARVTVDPAFRELVAATLFEGW